MYTIQKGVDEGWMEVSANEIDSVLRSLSKNWPESLQVYNFIKYCNLWSDKYPDVKTAVCCTVHPRKPGSVIAVMKGKICVIVAYSVDESCEDIAVALQDDLVVNWKEGRALFNSIPTRYCPKIEEVIESSGKKIHYKTLYDSFWIPANTAKSMVINCPDDIYFAQLDVSHGDTVNANWPYANEKSLDQITQMININDTVGIFTKKDSKLVCWVLHTFYGVGMLHTIESHRRKGYGSLAVKKLIKILGEKGTNPTILTLTDNHAARSLFIKIGFERLGQVNFISSI